MSVAGRPGLALLAGALLALACGGDSGTKSLVDGLASLERPSVVFILVDTLRADWTSPYGGDPEITPELARWAERGVVFERHRAQSSWTKISMASTLTSLWPRTHGIRLPTDGLGDEALTLAEIFSDAGYRTYAVQTNGWLDQSFGFHQGFERYTFPRGAGAQGVARPSVWPHGDRVFEEAARLIDAHDEREPFFLYLHLMDVLEYAAPPEFKRFGRGARGDYRAAIRWVDDVVERVRRKLERAGLLEQTILVFGADHGEAFGENGTYGHAKNVLTPVLAVPLVIRLPFAIEPLRIGAQTRNVDLAPTLLEFARIEPPAGFEGHSLLPLMAARAGGADDAAPRTSFAALGSPLFPDAVEQLSINDGRWTYARNLDEGGAEYLFDRSVDPAENVNLIDREPEEAARMRSLLDDHLGGADGGARVKDEDVRIDPAIAEKLRAMGYLR